MTMSNKDFSGSVKTQLLQTNFQKPERQKNWFFSTLTIQIVTIKLSIKNLIGRPHAPETKIVQVQRKTNSF